jgi:hypothetical protein
MPGGRSVAGVKAHLLRALFVLGAEDDPADVV